MKKVIKKTSGKKLKSKSSDVEFNKLSNIISGMLNVCKSEGFARGENKKFEDLVMKLIKELGLNNNPYMHGIKVCIEMINTYYDNRTEVLLNEREHKQKVIKLISSELHYQRNEVENKKKDLQEESDFLNKRLLDSGIYPPFIFKNFLEIYDENKLTHAEKSFALTIKDTVSLKNMFGSFVILAYRFSNVDNFLIQFPELKDFNFSKLKTKDSEYETMEQCFTRFNNARKTQPKEKVKPFTIQP